MKKNKKWLKITGILLAAVLLSGCENSNKNINDKQNETSSIADTNDITVLESPETGLIFSISNEYQEKGLAIEGPITDEQGHTTIQVNYYYKPVLDPLFNEILALPQEERTLEVQQKFYQALAIHSKCLMEIILVDEQEYKDAMANGKKPSDFSYWDQVEEFRTENNYTYLLAIPENNTDGMEEEEKQQYEACHNYIQTIKENLKFTKIEESAKMPLQMPAFTTIDLQGNSITEAIFAEKDLTVVNVWGTFCTPCIEEMPELGEWAKTMPDNVQLVGLIIDITGETDTKHRDLAVTISEKAGADFTQIIANQDFYSILNQIVGVPTTLFVDKNGTIIGDPIIGADVAGYKKFVEDYFNEQQKQQP